MRNNLKNITEKTYYLNKSAKHLRDKSEEIYDNELYEIKDKIDELKGIIGNKEWEIEEINKKGFNWVEDEQHSLEGEMSDAFKNMKKFIFQSKGNINIEELIILHDKFTSTYAYYYFCNYNFEKITEIINGNDDFDLQELTECIKLVEKEIKGQIKEQNEAKEDYEKLPILENEIKEEQKKLDKLYKEKKEIYNRMGQLQSEKDFLYDIKEDILDKLMNDLDIKPKGFHEFGDGVCRDFIQIFDYFFHLNKRKTKNNLGEIKYNISSYEGDKNPPGIEEILNTLGDYLGKKSLFNDFCNIEYEDEYDFYY